MILRTIDKRGRLLRDESCFRILSWIPWIWASFPIKMSQKASVLTFAINLVVYLGGNLSGTYSHVEMPREETLGY